MTGAGRGENTVLAELRTTLPPMQRTLSIVLHRAKKLGGTADGFLRHCLAA